MVVDKEQFSQKSSKLQEVKLRDLKRLGASVILAQGVAGAGKYAGAMHSKAVVLDDAVAFAGSANLTRKARRNHELVFRLSGPPVVRIA